MILMLKGNLNSTKNYEILWAGLQTRLKDPSELSQVALLLLQLQVMLAYYSMSELQNDNE